MFLNSTRLTLRDSFVLMGPDKTHSTSSYTREHRDGVAPSDWLLSRYHDESYVSAGESPRERGTMERWVRQLPVINPESAILLVWNLIVELAILFNLWEIPIAIFFTEQVYIDEFSTPALVAINVLIIIVFFIHFTLVRPLTGYYKSGILVSSPLLIIRSYARLELWFNLICWFVLILYAVANNPKLVYAKLIFFLSLYTLNVCDNQITVKLELKRLRFAAYRLIKLMNTLVYAVLWISCVYFAIDYHYYLLKGEYYPVNLWLTNSVCSQYQGGTKFIYLPEVYPWYVWLIYAFYWTLQSITGVGYGDMTPRNPVQVVLCNVVILFMTIAYAFFINSIWEIIAEVNETGDAKANHMRLVKKYQKKYKLEADLTNRLGSYIYDIWAHGKDEEAESSINDSLSLELRNELLLIRQQRFFAGTPLFSRSMWTGLDEFAEMFQELASHLKEKKFGSEETVFKAGDFHGKMCSVVMGEVKVQYENSTIKKKIEKETAFGVASFLTEQPIPYSAISQTFCKITYLCHDTMVQAIRNRPLFYERFMESVEELRRGQKYHLTGEDCWVCSSPTHPAHFCPQYFEWLFSLKEEEDIARKFHILQRSRETKVKQARRFFNRRKANKEKVVCGKPLGCVQVDTVHAYKFYRPAFSI